MRNTPASPSRSTLPDQAGQFDAATVIEFDDLDPMLIAAWADEGIIDHARFHRYVRDAADRAARTLRAGRAS